MKNLRSKNGPFAERPYYERHEIERTCVQELKAVGLLPDAPSPIRIERFIEKRFKVQVAYEDTEDGVLGYSRFGSRGLEAVIVSRALADDPSAPAERRVTTTIAHEAGHALLHAHIFALGDLQLGLFGDAVVGPTILCRDDADPTRPRPPGYDGRWWEFQANLAMSALLLPAPLVRKAVELFLVESEKSLTPSFPESRRESAILLLAERFDVNPVVARIRLSELYPEQGAQLTL